MKKAEIILLALAAAGLLLSIFLIPGGNITTALSLSCLSMLYFYFSFALFNGIRFRGIFRKSSYAGIKVLRVVGAIATGMAISMALIGILFRALSWPGADVMLLYGMIALVIPGIAAGVKYAATRDSFYKNILLHIAPIGIVAMVFFLLGGDIFYEFKYRDYPEMLKAYHNAKDQPHNEELSMKVEKERRKINEEK